MWITRTSKKAKNLIWVSAESKWHSIYSYNIKIKNKLKPSYLRMCLPSRCNYFRQLPFQTLDMIAKFSSREEPMDEMKRWWRCAWLSFFEEIPFIWPANIDPSEFSFPHFLRNSTWASISFSIGFLSQQPWNLSISMETKPFPPKTDTNIVTNVPWGS